MRFLFFILLLNSTKIFGQDNPYHKELSISDVIEKKDTFEAKYELYIDPKQIVDTLPLMNDDENNGWRDLQLVRYFLDNDSIIIISFRDGKRGDYIFFFEGSYLRKVRIAHTAIAGTKSYYYTLAENNDPKSQIKVSFENGILRKEKIDLLATGQTLKAKFMTSTKP